MPDAEALRSIEPEECAAINDGDPVWQVVIHTKTGLDKERCHILHFSSEDAVQENVRSLPVGAKFGDQPGFPLRLKEIVDMSKDKGTLGLSWFYGSGDQDSAHHICYNALSKAGVISEKDYRISPAVLSWLGEDQVAWMRETFTENWEVAAEFDYCMHHFPRSSLATLSAQLFFCQFISGDDYTAGYLTKEIETISGGTEGAAQKASEAYKKAGIGGGRASRERKLANLEILIEEIEGLKGAVGLVSEDRIVAQAFDTAIARHKNMPKSKKTRDDYETALRSEEPFKSRYEAVFRKNA